MRGLKRRHGEARDVRSSVAPLAGAWIETQERVTLAQTEASHLSQVRGLKLRTFDPEHAQRPSHLSQVRGLKRWCRCSIPSRRESHLSQVRGLKLVKELEDTRAALSSHLSQVRGLKHMLGRPLPGPRRVAPLAGAWIETTRVFQVYRRTVVAPLAGAWIETALGRRCGMMKRVAPLAGAWIETPQARNQ